jgi:hypothetical protein
MLIVNLTEEPVVFSWTFTTSGSFTVKYMYGTLIHAKLDSLKNVFES